MSMGSDSLENAITPIPQYTTGLAASQNCDLPISAGQDEGGRIKTPSILLTQSI